MVFCGGNHLVRCSEAESDRRWGRVGLDPGTRRLQGQRSRPLGHGFYNLLGRRAFILNAPLYLEMNESGWETKEIPRFSTICRVFTEQCRVCFCRNENSGENSAQFCYFGVPPRVKEPSDLGFNP